MGENDPDFAIKLALALIVIVSAAFYGAVLYERLSNVAG